MTACCNSSFYSVCYLSFPHLSFAFWISLCRWFSAAWIWFAEKCAPLCVYMCEGLFSFFFLVFILFGVSWASLIYGLLYFIVLGKFLAIMFSNISQACSSPLFFWCVRSFDIIPQLLGALFYSFSFLLVFGQYLLACL